MSDRLYIYQPGRPGCQTSVTTDATGAQWADFHRPRKLAADYVAELNAKRAPGSPAFEILTYEEMEPMIAAAEEARYIHPWKEITAERWHEMLNILPPQKWQTVAGVELFRMMEYTTGNITAHFARVNGRHFTGERRSTADYRTLAAEVSLAMLRLTLNPSQLRDARDWLAENNWGDIEAEDVANLSDIEVINGIARHYCGGIEGFICASTAPETEVAQ